MAGHAARSAAIAAVTVLAGCGGSATVSEPPPAPAAFAAAADAVCSSAQTRDGRVARLRGLRPPAGSEDVYAHWLRAEQDALNAVASMQDRSPDREGDPLVPLLAAEGKIAGYARRLGADTCAETAGGTMPG